ncbi:MAG: ABC transporter ATP-binding protein [Rhodospirillaceae bacterium]|nr:ABC transporter ATP-binding protein [Rhodospirillaceae bacterium]
MKLVPFLDIKQLSVEFQTRNGVVCAIEDVTLQLAKGEVLGIVGESGSGKSVTAYSVIGLLDDAGSPVSGSATFDGIPLTSASESILRDLRGREISMIFQNPRSALNPIRPVGLQIEDVLLRHGRATPQTAKAKAIEMLDKVKIVDPPGRYGSYPYELSGGMCQRVGIAIALSCDPRLLIADEPTTGLDVTTQQVTMDLIRSLTEERYMAVVLITHDLGMAAKYCDRIVVMEKGRVVETATVEALFSDPQQAYTKKLIAASPGPRSTLAELTPGDDGVSCPAIKPGGCSEETSASRRNILEVVSIVKEFPAHHKFTGLLPWSQGDKEPAPFRAVDNISFKLKFGESLGLVGESGCGKSTISNIIMRLMDPTSGDVIFDGHNIATYPAESFAQRPERQKIQMVFQDSTDCLNPRYSAHNCIAEPLKRLLGLRCRSEIRSKVEVLAQRVGLPIELLDRFPHQLSGGQKARVGIARAIAVDPLLLVLDEPTSALDVSVQAVVLQLLDRLKRDFGMSYIFVSHDLNVVRLLCEKVIVMNRGRIVESGQTETVLRHPSDPYTQRLIEAIPHLDPPEPRTFVD